MFGFNFRQAQQGTADASWPSRAHLFVGSTSGGAVRNGSSIEVASGRGEATRMTTISFARHQFLPAVIWYAVGFIFASFSVSVMSPA